MIIFKLFSTHLSLVKLCASKIQAKHPGIFRTTDRAMSAKQTRAAYPHGHSYGTIPRPSRALMHDPLCAIGSRNFSQFGQTSPPEA